MTVVDAMAFEAAAAAFEPARRRWATPGDLAVELDARTVQTPALDLIDAALVRLLDTPDGRLVISMSPQEGKSQRTSRRFPTWILTQNPETRIAVCSYELGVARRWGRAVRDDIVGHHQTLGLTVRDDLSAQHEWQLLGHEGGVYSVGIGGGLTGRPVDCVSADTHILTDRGRLTAAEAYARGVTRILAYDHAAGRAVWRDVEAARRVRGRRVVEVVTQAGRTLTCTPDHRVYTGRGYVPARDLRRGEALVALMGPDGMRVREPAGSAEDGRPQGDPPRPEHVPHGASQVEADTVAMVRERGGATVDVYDFQVAGTRNFFGDGVLVHNCLIIDDPIKDREQADSPTYRERAWDWWLEVGSTRLAPGAPVVVIATRWHEEDLIGKLLAAEDGHLWRVINIPAQADHDPAAGETDPLGREPGAFMRSARGRTTAQWEAIKVRSGSRTWNALYQGRPSPAQGTIFQRDWWQTYPAPRWIEREDGSRWLPGADEVAMSWDMAFKSTDSSDYVVGQVWARYGLHLYLIDQVRERMSFVETCARLREWAARWPQAIAKFVEDKANGTAVINALAKTVPGLIPVEPEGSKEARAAAVSPFVEAGQVHLPDPSFAPWIGDFIDEHASFPHGGHDDQVDAETQALNRILLNPILTGTVVDDGDLDDDVDGYEISPF